MHIAEVRSIVEQDETLEIELKDALENFLKEVDSFNEVPLT